MSSVAVSTIVPSRPTPPPHPRIPIHQEFVREQKRSALYQDAFGSKTRKTDLENVAAIATEFIPPVFVEPALPPDLEPDVSEAFHAQVADCVAADVASAVHIKVVLAATV